MTGSSVWFCTPSLFLPLLPEEPTELPSDLPMKIFLVCLTVGARSAKRSTSGSTSSSFSWDCRPAACRAAFNNNS